MRNNTECNVVIDEGGRIYRKDVQGFHMRLFGAIFNYDADRRRQFLKAATDKFGFEAVKNDALRYYKKMDPSYWRIILEWVFIDEKEISKYVNASRMVTQMIVQEWSDFSRNYSITREMRHQTEMLVESIERCTTAHDITELFAGEPRTQAIMWFLNMIMKNLERYECDKK